MPHPSNVLSVFTYFFNGLKQALTLVLAIKRVGSSVQVLDYLAPEG